MKDMLNQFKKPRVCEDGHSKLIYDADFFGGPGEKKCPVCEALRIIEKARERGGISSLLHEEIIEAIKG